MKARISITVVIECGIDTKAMDDGQTYGYLMKDYENQINHAWDSLTPVPGVVNPKLSLYMSKIDIAEDKPLGVLE